jgi:hypothetical protein
MLKKRDVVTTHIRVPVELHSRLVAAAAATQRSMSAQACVLIRDGLNERPSNTELPRRDGQSRTETYLEAVLQSGTKIDWEMFLRAQIADLTFLLDAFDEERSTPSDTKGERE